MTSIATSTVPSGHDGAESYEAILYVRPRTPQILDFGGGFWILDFGDFGFWVFWILGILGILDFGTLCSRSLCANFGFWGFWILDIFGVWGLGILDLDFVTQFWILYHIII